MDMKLKATHFESNSGITPVVQQNQTLDLMIKVKHWCIRFTVPKMSEQGGVGDRSFDPKINVDHCILFHGSLNFPYLWAALNLLIQFHNLTHLIYFTCSVFRTIKPNV